MDKRQAAPHHRANAGTARPVGKWHGIQAVAARYSVSDTEIRRQVRKGTFPKPVHLGARLARWSDAMLDMHDEHLLLQLEQQEAAA